LHRFIELEINRNLAEVFMSQKIIEKEIILDMQTESNIAYHKISWSVVAKQETMSSGGNIFHHIIPYLGTYKHSHDCIEILFIMSGTLKHCVNGEVSVLSQGNIVFIRPADSHFLKPHKDHQICEIISFMFSLKLFLTLSEYLENDIFLKQFTAPVLSPQFMIKGPKFTLLCNRVLSLNSISKNPLYKKIKIKILLAELFTHFFIDEINFLKVNTVPCWLESLCEAMRKPRNFIEGLSKMNSLAPCTKEHLCKSLKRYLNKTPTEFINELKMSYAARLLADSDEEIAMIAYELNIKSLSRFYSLFKQFYATSPANYRKNAKAGRDIL
jgi:AraC family cel operon transcriptional repressor